MEETDDDDRDEEGYRGRQGTRESKTAGGYPAWKANPPGRFLKFLCQNPIFEILTLRRTVPALLKGFREPFISSQKSDQGDHDEAT
uniref:Uncharacterized protein n=1 Tax=Cucumis melo TaxID=3656 RepID=A0A9I9DS69_CUCME